ncbi:hypothetical protein [Cryptosporangium phraense]|nr:hypothetical protein [Cryptosporangium phraense]
MATLRKLAFRALVVLVTAAVGIGVAAAPASALPDPNKWVFNPP